MGPNHHFFLRIFFTSHTVLFFTHGFFTHVQKRMTSLAPLCIHMNTAALFYSFTLTLYLMHSAMIGRILIRSLYCNFELEPSLVYIARRVLSDI